MRDLRLALASVVVLWALGACGSCLSTTSPASSSGPTQAELAGSRVSGPWKLTVRIDPYTGAQPPSTNQYKAGRQGVDTVSFVSTCAAAGA